jgi:hypothetical protein
MCEQCDESLAALMPEEVHEQMANIAAIIIVHQNGDAQAAVHRNAPHDLIVRSLTAAAKDFRRAHIAHIASQN